MIVCKDARMAAMEQIIALLERNPVQDGHVINVKLSDGGYQLESMHDSLNSMLRVCLRPAMHLSRIVLEFSTFNYDGKADRDHPTIIHVSDIVNVQSLAKAIARWFMVTHGPVLHNVENGNMPKFKVVRRSGKVCLETMKNDQVD